MTKRRLAALVLASAFVPRVAAAERAAVRVEAPPDCATAPSFWTSLRGRTDRLERAGPGDAASTIDAAFRVRDGGVEGDVRIARVGHASERRHVRGATCEEVESALSLIAALAFDPGAKLVPDPPPRSPATPPPAVTKEKVDVRPSPALEAAPSRVRWSLGATGGASSPGDVGLAPAYGLFGDVELDRPGLAPSVRLGVARATAGRATRDVDLEVTWMVARAALCPGRLNLGAGLSVRPCAAVEAGAIGTTASGRVIDGREQTRPWVAPGAALRLTWAPSALLFMGTEFGAHTPIFRDEFALDPDILLYRPPVFLPRGEIFAGVRFP